MSSSLPLHARVDGCIGPVVAALNICLRCGVVKVKSTLDGDKRRVSSVDEAHTRQRDWGTAARQTSPAGVRRPPHRRCPKPPWLT